MKRTWIVSGTWDRNGEPGWVTLHCDTRAEADALARARGLTVLEAMCAGGDPAATPTPPTPAARRAPPTKPIAKPPAAVAAKFASPPSVVAPPHGVARFAPPPPSAPNPAAGTASRATAPGRRMSPARQAAIEADPSLDGRWSATSALVLMALGLLVVIVGTLLTTVPEAGVWTGEFIQIVGAAGIMIGLRILSS